VFRTALLFKQLIDTRFLSAKNEVLFPEFFRMSTEKVALKIVLGNFRLRGLRSWARAAGVKRSARRGKHISPLILQTSAVRKFWSG
jgi:hypothetical protein